MDAAQREKVSTFIADRYKRSQTVLDLMMKKLPVYAAPLGVLTGTQIVELYSRLGETTGNEADKKKALELLTDEINLYKQYVLYFQTLTPRQYSLLTRNDRYINDTYFIQLLQLYADCGGDVESLMKQLQGEGINFSRYFKSAPETGSKTLE